MSKLILPPLSLYIHIPWCIRKCPYCDFNSHAKKADLPEADYIAALTEDLEQDLKYVQSRKLQSIFLGGGTPSLFSAQGIDRILNAAEQKIGFADSIEITLEANPGTFEQQKFRDFRAAGINRLSIGIQSFDDLCLQQLGRIHNSDEALHVAAAAREAGFSNFNLDLMHGLPGQSVNHAINDLQTAIELDANHISWYQLTIEPNTEFYSQPPKLPDDPILEDIFEQGQRLLADSGYRQYEVSAYAKDSRASTHNLNYWSFGDYLGIGAGAHGKVSLPDNNDIIRTRKTRTPADYLNAEKAFTAATEIIPHQNRTLEFLMNALRLNDGVPAPFFSERTGQSQQPLASRWQTLQQRGLVAPLHRRIQPTETGHRFLNTILAEFM